MVIKGILCQLEGRILGLQDFYLLLMLVLDTLHLRKFHIYLYHVQCLILFFCSLCFLTATKVINLKFVVLILVSTLWPCHSIRFCTWHIKKRDIIDPFSLRSSNWSFFSIRVDFLWIHRDIVLKNQYKLSQIGLLLKIWTFNI